MTAKKLAIVMPCYNEEDVLKTTIPIMSNFLAELVRAKLVSASSQLVFVDDGSTDKTYEILSAAAKKDKSVAMVKFSANSGHQRAVLAGLYTAQADVYVSLDADLQDDYRAIREMLKLNANGSEVVYGVRDSRKTDSVFKRWTARLFYGIMKVLGANTVPNSADFRLISRRVVDEMKKFPERNFFIRGIVPSIGFKSSKVFYDRAKRSAGASKYPLRKMLAFAFDGITSFSVAPLRFITLLGFLISTVSFMLILFVCIRYFMGHTLVGWASTVSLNAFFNGIIIFSLGIIGEYVGRILIEVKRRPLYIIESTENIGV